MNAAFERRFFRYIRYMFYNLRKEFFCGTPEKRRHFVGRISDFAGRLFRLDHISRWLFLLSTRGPEQHRLWLRAIRGLENRDYLQKWAQAPDLQRVRIIIFGAGSIGDLIQTTPILRAMRDKFPNGDIVFLHRSPAVKAVLGSNPHINCLGFANFSTAARVKDAVAREGIADLFLEIESGTYVAQYALAPPHLRSPLVNAAMPQNVFDRAALALQKRQMKPRFRKPDGTYSWPDQWQGVNFLDILGATTGLPIDRYAELDFDIAQSDRDFAASIATGRNLVTIQNGVDDAVAKWAYVTGRHATKLLPLPLWRETVRQLIDKGFYVVQLGTQDDALIEGVSCDLRGKTSLREAAALMQRAICHVGTEGGLVHLARAMKTKSVVLFGPTSIEFLGYPQNINLAVGNCNSCWQSARDWYIYCPRGFDVPPCMQAHRPEMIVAAVEEIWAAIKPQSDPAAL